MIQMKFLFHLNLSHNSLYLEYIVEFTPEHHKGSTNFNIKVAVLSRPVVFHVLET